MPTHSGLLSPTMRPTVSRWFGSRRHATALCWYQHHPSPTLSVTANSVASVRMGSVTSGGSNILEYSTASLPSVSLRRSSVCKVCCILIGSTCRSAGSEKRPPLSHEHFDFSRQTCLSRWVAKPPRASRHPISTILREALHFAGGFPQHRKMLLKK